MKCPLCNFEVREHTPYSELWYCYYGGEKVYIRCTQHPLETAKFEKPNPHRFVLEFGKYKGRRLTEINDLSYLRYLEDESESLQNKCIQLCL